MDRFVAGDRAPSSPERAKMLACAYPPDRHIELANSQTPMLTGRQINEIIQSVQQITTKAQGQAKTEVIKKRGPQPLIGPAEPPGEFNYTPPEPVATPTPSEFKIAIRQSYMDVLKAEDPTIGADASVSVPAPVPAAAKRAGGKGKTMKTAAAKPGASSASKSSSAGGGGQSTGAIAQSTLSGAAFSYTHSHKDTWSSQGALILSWIHQTRDVGKNSDFTTVAYGAIASASLDKVSSGDPSTKNVDSLIFRGGGIYSALPPSTNSFHYEIDATASATYATDTNFQLSIPGGGFNLEPRFQLFRGGIGYRFNAWVDDSDPDYPRHVIFGYMLRAWLHGEGGIFEHQSSMSPVPEGDFFRLGPTVQANLYFPRLFNGTTVTAEYHFLPSLYGPTGHAYYFTTGVEFDIWPPNNRSVYATPPDPKSVASLQKITLKVSYENGGLDFSKQSVDNLKVGLGITW